MDVMLGKSPPRRYYSDVKIKLANYIDKAALPAPPRTLPAIGRNISFGMFMNDTKPDCTCASIGHKAQIDSTRSGHPEQITDDIIMELFHSTGAEQGLTDDDGREMEGVLQHLKSIGLRQPAGDPNDPVGSFEKIIGYAAVNFHDLLEYRTALWLFGGLYLGIALPEIAEYQIENGKPWSLETKYGGSSAAGSWGGHAVWATTGGTLVTWGARQSYTDGFRRTYFDECYAVLTEDWVQNGKAPNGFNRDQLVEDLRSV